MLRTRSAGPERAISRAAPVLVAGCLAALVASACTASNAASGGPTPVRTTPVSTAHTTTAPTSPAPASVAPSSAPASPVPSVLPSPTFAPVVAPASCHPSTKASAVDLSSKQFLFTTKCLGVAAGAPFVIRYRNGGGLGNPTHNVAIYRDPGGLSNVYRGGIVLADTAHTYHVKALPAGVYMFLCDLHPDTMRGYLVVG